MKKKNYTVAILGVGARGSVYGSLMTAKKDAFRIVALCDYDAEKLHLYGNEFGVNASELYQDESVFFKKKRADVLVIATQDKDHIRHALKAFALGYDVLLEKPITDKIEDGEALIASQKKYGCKAVVCHVLRYAPAFLKAKELLDNGEIGALVAINALERVAYWHQAHSYVRGNWRKREESTPMIMAKCCHDLDLLQYYAKSKCESVSSVGDLHLFKKENKPQGATARCVDCPHKNTCAYSAVEIYIERWKKEGRPAGLWPHSVIALAPLTEEKLYEAIENGPYGRCVYDCDNDVVDYQSVQATFENGVKATLTMTAFTKDGGRRFHFYGTQGEIVLEEQNNCVRLERFDGRVETFNIDVLNESGYGHGGGDFYLIEKLYEVLCGDEKGEVTSLQASWESHLIALSAEESRLLGGRIVFPHKRSDL